MVNKCKGCEERQRFIDSFESEKPYIEIMNLSHLKVRKFPADTEPHLLKWHHDEEDRLVMADHPTDWMFQFDNELPIPFPINDFIKIPKGRIHRLIKGSGDLVLSIELSDDAQV